MMIIFEKIRWRNVLSTGSQFTEVELNRSTNTLIVGENGAGKSTILDAICFVLFNKPFRKINKPQLINSINQKNLTVELELTVGSKHYKIVRGIKPTVFELYLDGVLLNQDAAAKDYQKYLEEHILKRNYKSFTQIDILGSASFKPFMQLETGNRREIIEELLDIKVFSSMNDILKEKISTLKDTITDYDNRLEVGKTKAKLQSEYIKTLEGDKDKRIATISNEILTNNTQIQAHLQEVQSINNEITTLEQTIQDRVAVRRRQQEISTLLHRFNDKLDQQATHLQFYKSHDECPICKQDLSRTHKESAQIVHAQKINEIEQAIVSLNEQRDETTNRINEIVLTENNIATLKARITSIESNIETERNFIKKLEKELNDITSSHSNIDDEKQKLKVQAKEIVKLTEERAKLTEDRHYLDIASVLLKDTGIKTRIVNQYLPVINKLINKYLQAMDMFVVFELDESFNETIKSRHRDEFSYASFSEGEKARIDLAILFAWRTIARTKNTAHTNLLILDEVFDSSLDVAGTEFVTSILSTLDAGTNTIVISHKDTLHDRFENVIRFEKHNNFSRIAT